MENSVAIVATSMEVPQNLKTDLPCYPAKPLLGVQPKEITPACLSTIQVVKSAYIPINKRVDKANVVSKHNGVLVIYKEESK